MISRNDWLWKGICRQHGFFTTKPASSMLSEVNFTETCIDCIVKPSTDDCLRLVTESTSALPPSEDLPATSDDHCSNFECQANRFHPSHSYKKMFLSHRRIFSNFTGGQSLNTIILSGYTNRITAIDYHNGYVVTG